MAAGGTFDRAALDSTFSGPITGSGMLTKLGRAN